MPRLFTGLEIPEDARFQLSLLRGGVAGARWVEPENYHLTLSFVGDIDGADAADLSDELSHVSGDPLTIEFDDLGSFGGDKPRAIFARAVSSPALMRLHEQNERAVRRVGLTTERRKFIPHVTLARLKSASPMAVADYLASRSAPALRFTVDRFVLFSARASTGGGPYLVEAAYPLDGYQGSSTESQ
jgi:RNA 2',3'-cyclic 3'-phosphodiesterase